MPMVSVSAGVSSARVELSELEQQFFAQGLSEDALAAASEREQERELLLPRSSLVNRVLLGAAVCAGLGVATVGFVGGGNGGNGGNAATRTTAGASAPATAPVQAAALVAELRPPPAAPAEPEAPAELEGSAELEATSATTDPMGPPRPVAALAAQGMDDPRLACDQMLRRGRFKDIDQRCAAAFAAQPSAELAGRVAEMALDRGRNGDAATWARRAIGADGRYALAFVYLGGAEQEMGRPEQAREAFARYLELAPEGQHADDIRHILANDAAPAP